jgi:hypothetical protein
LRLKDQAVVYVFNTRFNTRRFQAMGVNCIQLVRKTDARGARSEVTITQPHLVGVPDEELERRGGQDVVREADAGV